jgi:hypothetical protein
MAFVLIHGSTTHNHFFFRVAAATRAKQQHWKLMKFFSLSGYVAMIFI